MAVASVLTKNISCVARWELAATRLLAVRVVVTDVGGVAAVIAILGISRYVPVSLGSTKEQQ